MEIPVIIEPVTGNGHRAIGAGGLSVGLTAEGSTPAEAIDRLADQVRTRVQSGATLAERNVASDPAPWSQDAGYLRNEPLYDSSREAMDEYQRSRDEDPKHYEIVPAIVVSRNARDFRRVPGLIVEDWSVLK